MSDSRATIDEIRASLEGSLNDADVMRLREKFSSRNIDLLTLSEELAIHQVELEAQNQELRNSRETAERARDRYARLFSELPDAALTLDRLGLILSANQQALDLFGYEFRHVRRHFLQRLVDPLYADQLSERLRLVYKDGKRRSIKLRLPREHLPTAIVELHLTRLSSDEHEHDHELIGILVDLTQHECDKAALKARQLRSDLLLKLPKLAEEADERDFLQHALDEAEQLTESVIGFIHLVNDDQVTIELGVWSTQTREHYCKATADSHYPLEQAGFWADTLRTRQRIICNEYAHDARQRGLPAGHAELTRMVAVPVMEHQRVCMIIGVGNKSCDYSDDDAESLELIGNAIWSIASQRRARRAFEHAHWRLHEAQRFAHVGDWEWDLHTDTMTCSDELYRIVGLEPGTPIDYAGVRALHSAESAARIDSAVQQALRDGSSYELELSAERPDGSTVFFIANGAVQRDAAGEVSRLYGSMLDVTALKTAEQQALEAHRHVLDILESTTDAFLELDHAFTLRYINHKAYAALRLPDDQDLVGCNLLDLLPVPLDEPLLEQYRTAVREQQPTLLEFYYPGFDQWYECHLYPSPHSVSVYFRIVTERKRMEQQLREAMQHAHDANQAKSRFLATMSHELRTPLNTIINLSQQAFECSHEQRQRDYLHKTRRAAQDLLAIVNDILAFSRAQTAALQTEAAVFDLHDLIIDSSTMLTAAAADKALALYCTAAPTLPRWLIGDRRHLQQVLNNLLSNAVKFTNQGDIVLRIEALDTHADHLMLRFQVQDTGIGLSQTQRGQLFQPFDQLDGGINRRYGGTGLGLVVCRQLITLMGGELEVKSRSGQGSVFSFTVPFKRARPGVLLDLAQVQAFQPRRVLVLSAPGALGRFIDETLGALGIAQVQTLEACPDATQALRQARASHAPLDVIMIDTRLIQNASREMLTDLASAIDDPGGADALRVIAIAPYASVRKTELPFITVDAWLEQPLTAFRVLNAIKDAQSQDSAPRSDTGTASNSCLHALIVDDDAISQQMMRVLLEKLGLEVMLADSGERACEYLLNHHCDLVLIDLHMSGISGIETTARLRTSMGLHDVVIVGISAELDAAQSAQWRQAGADLLLTKPVRYADLSELLVAKLNVSRLGQNPTAPMPQAPREMTLPLLDRALALQHSGGDERLYAQLLAQFHARYRDCGKELQTLLAASQLKDAFQLVHGIKGVSRLLGLSRLDRAVQAVSGALKLGTMPDTGARETFFQILAETLETVSSMHSERAAVPCIREDVELTDVADLIARLKDWQALLDEDITAARQQGESLSRVLESRHFAAIMQMIQDAFNRYDFAQVDELIETLIRMLEERQSTAVEASPANPY